MRAESVVNATGVWADEVRALDEGAHPRSIRPAKGIHITVPWQKAQNEIAVVIPVPKDRRSVFVVPWGDLAYVGTTDTDYDGPARRSAVHAATTSTTCCARSTRRSRPASRGGHPRHVGGSAPAREGRDERTHRRPVPPPLRAAIRERRRDRHRRQAHDLPADGGRHRRRGCPGARHPSPHRHEARRAPRRRRLRPRPASRRARCAPRVALRHRGRHGRIARRERSRPRAPARAGPALLARRGRVRRTSRDGTHARRRADPADTRSVCWVATTRPRPPTTSPRSWLPSSAGPTPSVEREVAAFRDAVAPSAPRQRCPRPRSTPRSAHDSSPSYRARRSRRLAALSHRRSTGDGRRGDARPAPRCMCAK